jgi:2-C-methyl-D-erythritol 2,4-cyclodiphosphate synthase
VFRVGIGIDIHPFAAEGEGRPLVLGGHTLAGERGLSGHSDADVLVHAVCDALLGAVALGDLGRHFPDTDPRYAGCSSLGLLRDVRRMVEGRGWRPSNVDASLLAERPRLSPHVEVMCRNLAEALGLAPGAVSVKAVRPEGLGALGRGEGISCHAVVLMERAGPPGAIPERERA